MNSTPFLIRTFLSTTSQDLSILLRAPEAPQHTWGPLLKPLNRPSSVFASPPPEEISLW